MHHALLGSGVAVGSIAARCRSHGSYGDLWERHLAAIDIWTTPGQPYDKHGKIFSKHPKIVEGACVRGEPLRE